MSAPKNWRTPAPLSQLLPVGQIDEKNYAQNIIQIIKQLRKQLENLESQNKENEGITETDVRRIINQILNPYRNQVSQEFTEIRNLINQIDTSRYLTINQFNEFLIELERDYASKDWVRDLLKNYRSFSLWPFGEFTVNPDGEGFDFILNSDVDKNDIYASQWNYLLYDNPDFNWAGADSKFYFNYGIYGASWLNILGTATFNNGATVYGGLNADTANISTISAFNLEVDGTIINSQITSFGNRITNLENQASIPTPPNDNSGRVYSLQSINGTLQWN